MTDNEKRQENFDGLTLTEVTDFSLIYIATRGSRQGATRAIKSAFSTSVPLKPGKVTGNDKVRIFWFGPNSWLIRQPGSSLDAIPELKGCATADMSDSRCQFRIEGEKAIELLSAGCPIDIENNLPPRTSAQTTYNHFQILLHHESKQTFDVYVLRSYADDLWQEVSDVASLL